MHAIAALLLLAGSAFIAACRSAPPTLAPEAGWFAYEPPDKTFTALFPGRPPSIAIDPPTATHPVKTTHYSSSDSGTTFIVQVYETENGFYRSPEAAEWFRGFGKSRLDGWAEGAVLTDSIIRGDPLNGSWGRIEGQMPLGNTTARRVGRA